MKKLLAAMFVALLMVGCGSPDLDDKETFDGIIAEAIDEDKLQKRGEKGEELRYAPNEQTPYTGWAKTRYDNGQVGVLQQYKDGKPDGLSTYWYESGRKGAEGNFKDGKKDGLFMEWYENGQKRFEKNWKNGKDDGLSGTWYSTGQIRDVSKWAMGKIIVVKSWKPNGEKCPHTNLVDGNGVWFWYNLHGGQLRNIYKDGEYVDTTIPE